MGRVFIGWFVGAGIGFAVGLGGGHLLVGNNDQFGIGHFIPGILCLIVGSLLGSIIAAVSRRRPA